MSVIFHGHPLSSFTWKVLVALYERGVPFEYAFLDLSDPVRRAEFLGLWAIGLMPVVEDKARGLTLAESSIIIEHLDHLHRGPDPLVPAPWDAARETRFWDRFYDLYVMAPMQRIVAERLRPNDALDPFGEQQARDRLATAFDVAEAGLADRTWAAGERFSLADCAAAPALHYAQKVAPFIATHARLAAYLGRLEARPSFARVLEEAKPYAHLFPQARSDQA